ncbi:hypothetical protein NDU88_002604 [Pleurodeles waltl]|uniref:Uncharacterized protein n=1 Tax=Pleurodeles waltl TaxID=8319 RepID=A0AAV7UYZ4_PLEWA|nr:hypothetical protein NDU88_002604 [Pleurodeles waltl]
MEPSGPTAPLPGMTCLRPLSKGLRSRAVTPQHHSVACAAVPPPGRPALEPPGSVHLRAPAGPLCDSPPVGSQSRESAPPPVLGASCFRGAIHPGMVQR